MNGKIQGTKHPTSNREPDPRLGHPAPEGGWGPAWLQGDPLSWPRALPARRGSFWKKAGVFTRSGSHRPGLKPQALILSQSWGPASQAGGRSEGVGWVLDSRKQAAPLRVLHHHPSSCREALASLFSSELQPCGVRTPPHDLTYIPKGPVSAHSPTGARALACEYWGPESVPSRETQTLKRTKAPATIPHPSPSVGVWERRRGRTAGPWHPPTLGKAKA